MGCRFPGSLEWAKRFPDPAIGGKEGEIEVRQFFELEDFTPGEAIAVAGRIPGARKGTVEIRPVQEIPGLPAKAAGR